MKLELTIDEVIQHFADIHAVSRDCIIIVYPPYPPSDEDFVKEKVINCARYENKIAQIKALRDAFYTEEELQKFIQYGQKHWGGDCLNNTGSLGLAFSKWLVERFNF